MCLKFSAAIWDNVTQSNELALPLPRSIFIYWLSLNLMTGAVLLV